MNLINQTVRFLSVAGLIFSASAAFSQVVTINPGDQIVIPNGPTLVFCKQADSPFRPYCKCNEVGFSRTPTLQMIIDRDANTDDLASYTSMSACEAALRTNPGCIK